MKEYLQDRGFICFCNFPCTNLSCGLKISKLNYKCEFAICHSNIVKVYKEPKDINGIE
jgi:hypothetical protein